MADLLFIAIVVAFFMLCVGYVRLCDRIIGPDSPDRESVDAGHAADGGAGDGDALEAVGA